MTRSQRLAVRRRIQRRGRLLAVGLTICGLSVFGLAQVAQSDPQTAKVCVQPNGVARGAITTGNISCLAGEFILSWPAEAAMPPVTTTTVAPTTTVQPTTTTTRPATTTTTVPAGPVQCSATISAPASISTALNGLSAGQTLCLRNGTYGPTTLSKSGTSSAPIIVRSYPGETATISGAGQSIGSTSAVVQINGAYLTVSNVEIGNSSGRGVAITGTGSRITGSKVYGTQYSGILAAGSNNLIDNNEVFNTVLRNTNRALGNSGWAEAINTWRATNTTIRDNNIHDNWGEGIDYIASNGGLASGNRVCNNYSVGIYVDGSSNITIDNNRVGSTVSTYDRSYGAAWGVLVASEGGGAVSNIRVTNNQWTRVTGPVGVWGVSASVITQSNNSTVANACA